MKESRPALTIITPSFNSGETILRALESVPHRSESAIEHIVVDGGSLDGTLGLLASFAGVESISEPDRGLYDALNKGITRARGEFVGFLNSDDWYEEGALVAVLAVLNDSPDVDVVSGGARFVVLDGSGEDQTVGADDSSEVVALSIESVAKAPNINARFFRRTFLQRVGKFEFERYPLAADRDFLFRAALLRPKQISLSEQIYCYLSHPGSKTLHGGWRQGLSVHRENLQMAEAYLTNPSLTKHDTQFMKDWHGVCSTRLAASEILNGNLMPGIKSALLGMKRSGRWPKIALEVMMAAIARKRKKALAKKNAN